MHARPRIDARSRMRLTGLGWKALAFYAVILSAFFSAPYANLFFLLVMVSTVLALATVVWSWRNVAGVDGAVATWAPVTDGGGHRAEAWIDRGRRRRCAVGVRVSLENGASIRFGTDDGVGRTTLQAELPALTRGVYAVTDAVVESSWPVGFVRGFRRIPVPAALVVYPAPDGDARARSGAGGGAGEGLAAGGRLHPSGLRAFRVGDEPRSIHWRATARRNRPVVLEWDGGGGDGLDVVLDRRGDDATLDTRLRRVAAIATVAREEERVVTLRTQGAVVSYGVGQAPWDELWRVLATADALPSTAAPPPAASADAIRVGAAS